MLILNEELIWIGRISCDDSNDRNERRIRRIEFDSNETFNRNKSGMIDS